jgi:hypothetical protein
MRIAHSLLTGTALVGAVLGSLVLTSPAGAAPATAGPQVACIGTAHSNLDHTPNGRFFTAAANIRTGPSTACKSVGLGEPSDTVDFWCWQFGQTVNGVSTWTYIQDETTGKAGWVSDTLLGGGAAIPDQC